MMDKQKAIEKLEQLRSKGVDLDKPCPKCSGKMQIRPTPGSIPVEVIQESTAIVVKGWDVLGIECNNCGYLELYHIL